MSGEERDLRMPRGGCRALQRHRIGGVVGRQPGVRLCAREEWERNGVNVIVENLGPAEGAEG